MLQSIMVYWKVEYAVSHSLSKPYHWPPFEKILLKGHLTESIKCRPRSVATFWILHWSLCFVWNFSKTAVLNVYYHSANRLDSEIEYVATYVDPHFLQCHNSSFAHQWPIHQKVIVFNTICIIHVLWMLSTWFSFIINQNCTEQSSGSL